jgi:thiol-disulfide isomerase/thioredoxin
MYMVETVGCGGDMRTLALIAFVAAVALAGCGRTPPDVDPGLVGVEQFAPGEREPAPQIRGTTLTGEPFDLADYRGSTVVLNSWASWCAPCLIEMPVLIDAANTYADSGVRVIGINALDDPTNAGYFVEDLGIPFASVQDSDGAILASLPGVPPRALPNTLVIDADGNVAARIIGPLTDSILNEVLQGVQGKSLTQ